MSRDEVETDIRETLGTVPSFFGQVPDDLIESEWHIFKSLQLGETTIPNKYKELIGIAVSGATRCSYCAYFHTTAARLFGATDEEIAEASMIAKHTMGWSSYINALQIDLAPLPWSRVSRVLRQQGGFECPAATRPGPGTAQADHHGETDARRELLSEAWPHS